MEIRMGILLGSLASVLAASVAWGALSLPRPALNTEVAQVEQFSKGTRKLVLNDRWFRTKALLDDADRRLETEPDNQDLRDLRLRYQEQMRDVDAQLEKLKQ